MTKHQDLKNEAKRSWKLKNAKVVPVMTKHLLGMMTKNLTEILTRVGVKATQCSPVYTFIVFKRLV